MLDDFGGWVKRVLNHLQMACQICAEGFVNREGLSVLGGGIDKTVVTHQ